MTKKIFAIIIAILLIFATSSVFATNTMDKAGSMVKNVVDGTGNVLRDTGAAITDGAKNLGEDIGNGAKNMGETINNGARNVGEAINNGARDAGAALSNGASRVTTDLTRNDNRDGGYTATRTSTESGTIMGMSANTWTWFILAITALAIIALVWYYAMENKNEYGKHHNN